MRLNDKSYISTTFVMMVMPYSYFVDDKNCLDLPWTIEEKFVSYIDLDFIFAKNERNKYIFAYL